MDSTRGNLGIQADSLSAINVGKLSNAYLIMLWFKLEELKNFENKISEAICFPYLIIRFSCYSINLPYLLFFDCFYFPSTKSGWLLLLKLNL